MPTVFERIDVSLQGNGLADSLAGQAAKLADAAQRLRALIQNPPSSIPQLASGLGSVALPKLDVGDFASQIGTLGGALPLDLSGATQAVSEALARLKVGVNADVGVKLQAYVEAVRAIERLMKARFSPPPDVFAAGAAPSPAPAPGPAPGPAAEPAPAPGPAPSPGPDAAPGPGPAPAPAADPAAQARARRLEALSRTNAFFADQPAFDAPGFVVYLRDTLVRMPREQAKVRKLPLFDNLLWLVVTSVALHEMGTPQLKQHVDDTLRNLHAFLASVADWPVGALVTHLQQLGAKLDAAALQAEVDALSPRLDAIAAAVDAGTPAAAAVDIAAANATLDTLLPRLAALDVDLFSGQVDAAIRSMQRLPLELDRQMRRAAQAVRPTHLGNTFAAIGAELDAAVGLAAPADIAADVEAMTGQVVEVLASFDAAPLCETLGTAIEGLNTAAEQVDRLLSDVASKVSLAFDQLDKALAQVDPAPLLAQVEQAIARFGEALQAKVDELFGPVRTAIAQGIAEIANAVSGFDPSAIVDALKDAIQKLADVLDAPEVKNAIAAIRQAIEAAADQIGALSFSPVTGSVIVEIDAVTELLKKLDPSKLGMPAKLALTGAVALLPDDLSPVTSPVEAEFATLVDVGPKPLLTQVQAQPQKLLDQVRRFSPDQLIGDELSKPLADLIRELEKFRPSTLLEPVNDALAQLKQEIARRADPSQAFAPLEAAFDSVLQRLDALDPSRLVQPLDAELRAAIDDAVTALPADELVAALDAILVPVQHVRDMVVAARTAIEGLQARFAGLADGESQIRAWYQPVLDKVGAIDDVSTLQPAFDAVTAMLERLKATPLSNAINASAASLMDTLTDLAPDARLATLSRSYRGIRGEAVAALPASADKAAIQALLVRFSPAQASFARPFEGLARWRGALRRDLDALAPLLAHWDARFQSSPHGVFAGFARSNVTAADVRALMSDALEREVIRPLGALVGAVHGITVAAEPVVGNIGSLAGALQAKIDELVTGPGAIGGVRDSLAALIARLRAINLQFLIDELHDVFASVKSKLQAIGPAAVRASVKSAFDGALNALDVSHLLPAAELAAIDQSYEQILATLRALDPKKIVVQAVQPEFEAKVVPLAAAFDITVVAKASIERLDALKAELSAEFAKVNASYQAMLAAVPTISLTDISLDVDLDVGVDLGF
jgi:hypothetical protein